MAFLAGEISFVVTQAGILVAATMMAFLVGFCFGRISKQNRVMLKETIKEAPAKNDEPKKYKPPPQEEADETRPISSEIFYDNRLYTTKGGDHVHYGGCRHLKRASVQRNGVMQWKLCRHCFTERVKAE